MRIITLIIVLLVSYAIYSQENLLDIDDCWVKRNYGMITKEVKLQGSVYVVKNPNEFADFRVKVVKDPKTTTLWVKIVDMPSECGEWKWVKREEDAAFSIRFVDEGEHFSIMFIGNNERPGCRY